MKKNLKNIIFIIIMLSNIFASSSLRSTIFPGWGEIYEFNILSEDVALKDIEYIG